MSVICRLTLSDSSYDSDSLSSDSNSSSLLSSSLLAYFADCWTELDSSDSESSLSFIYLDSARISLILSSGFYFNLSLGTTGFDATNYFESRFCTYSCSWLRWLRFANSTMLPGSAYTFSSRLPLISFCTMQNSLGTLRLSFDNLRNPLVSSCVIALFFLLNSIVILLSLVVYSLR